MSGKLTLIVAFVLAGAWGLIAIGEALGADDNNVHGPGRAAAGRQCQVECMDKMSAANQHLDAAVKAIEAGEKKAALTHLKAARAIMGDMHKTCSMRMDKGSAVATANGGEYVNTHCPIMGSKLDPARLTAKLTREWQGKKVGFCCAGCPDKWDKLSEEAKQAALEKVTPKPSATPAPAPEGKRGAPAGGGCCAQR